MKKHLANTTYFIYFFLFNLCFWGLQAAYLYSENGSFVSSLKLPAIAWQQILATLIIHFFLYLLLSLLQVFLLKGILTRSWHLLSRDTWQIIIWGLSVCVLLSANAYYFPLSIFSKLLSPPLPEAFMLTLLAISGTLLSLLLLNSILAKSLIPYTGTGVVLTLLLWIASTPYKPHQIVMSNQPNIILLGIDSLSPNSVTPQNMPFFSNLIQHSLQFTNSISPLARTYPAWTSILTGLYVKHHHAEENLVPKNTVKSEASIAWLLQNKGYNTIFATDDRRFNSIDKEFGFKKIIGPKTGVNDILIGSFNDFPLSNLLINGYLSHWLFPFNYSNRASFFSYYPQTFDERLQSELNAIVKNFPVFLAVHFTLPHWPYAWAESLPEQVSNEFSLEKRDQLYQQALLKVDQQFQSFFNYLQQKSYFKNTLLIILSDHGEVLYYPNSRLTNYQNYQGQKPSRFAEYLQKNTATVLNKSAGHGSDILSPQQYHNVLAFRIYQNSQMVTPVQQISTRVALIDLAPTIMDFLNLNNLLDMDGISLLPVIKKPGHLLGSRNFFIESGMFPNQLLSKQKSIEIGSHFYNVNPVSGELEIKPDKIAIVNQQKIYGVISDDWILALYPDKDNYIPVIQNLISGQWIDNLESDFAQKSPAAMMKKKMHEFYGKKIFLPVH